MYEHAGAQDGVVVHDHLSGQLGAVADDASVADEDVVCHVHSLHEQIVAAHDGLSLGGGASVDGHVLAYLVVVSDLGGGVLAAEEYVAASDTGAVEHGDAVHKHVVIANHYASVDVAEGTYLTVLSYDGLGVYVGQGADLTHSLSC